MAPTESPGTPVAAPFLSLRMLALLCIVLPVLVYAVVGVSRYRQLHIETEVRLDRALRIAEEHALKVLDTNETVLARVLDAVEGKDDESIRKASKFLHQQLNAMARNKSQIQSIWVQDARGKPLVTDHDHPAPPDATAADSAYFRWHQEKRGGLYLSEPLSGRVDGTSFFDMSRGRYHTDGSFAGVVSIGLLPPYFEKFHDDLAANEPGLAITMLREDGVILTRWPSLPDAPPRLALDSPVMSLIRAGSTGGTAHGTSSVDGRNRLLAYSQVGDYPVYIGTGMAVDEIRRRWLKEMAWLAAFVLPPLLGLFLAARVALRRTRDSLQTAQRLNEEMVARRRVEESLLQSQKLEALGRLTGGVAHDFNNALMVISNNLFLLKRKSSGADTPHIDSIGRAVDSATKLTRQLLAFSRRQALVPEYVKLQEKLPTFQALLGPLLGSQIELSVQAAPDTAPILVDFAELELALINLAINAQDAMPEGGQFRLAARNAAGEQPPVLEGPMVLIEASDTGAGIDPEILDKVFDPFFTTKPTGEGTGLGLSQIYGLCQRAGGLATIQSVAGSGTTVRLFFPAAPHREVDPSAAPPALPTRLGKSVLLVEDNDEVAAALRTVLQTMGCDVTRVNSADAAEAWLADRERLPDLLLTDVVMPGDLDGAELAERVRSRFPSVGILMMTGYAEQLEAISSQGFDIIPKPCSPELLATTIVRIVGK